MTWFGSSFYLMCSTPSERGGVIYVDVGLGFFVEMSLDEALAFAESERERIAQAMSRLQGVQPSPFL
jgi:prefoldin subunit 5